VHFDSKTSELKVSKIGEYGYTAGKFLGSVVVATVISWAFNELLKFIENKLNWDLDKVRAQFPELLRQSIAKDETTATFEMGVVKAIKANALEISQNSTAGQ